MLEPREVVVAEPEVLESDLDVVAVEDPHDDRLSMRGWDDADTQVDVLAGDQDLDPAVLGAAFLGDVDRAHDLEAADDRAQEPAGGVVAFHQHAVDPVADPDPVGERLDVDVATPGCVHGFLDDQVHQLDDRRVAFLQGVGGARLAAGRPVLGEVDRGVGELLEHRVDRLGLGGRPAIILVDRLDDRFLGGERDLDLAVQHEPQLVDRLEVERIMHDHTDGAALLGEGHDDVLAGERFGDELDDRGGDLDLVELDERQAVLLGLGLHDVVGVGVTQLDQRLLDRPPGPLLASLS